MAANQDIKLSDYLKTLSKTKDIRSTILSLSGNDVKSFDNGSFVSARFDFDVSNLPSCGGTILSSTKKWMASANYYGTLIDVSEFVGKQIEIVANDAASDYAFLKEGFSAGNAASFASGNNAVYTIASGRKICVTIPSDAKYLYVYIKSGSSYYTPKSIALIDNANKDLKEGVEFGFRDVDISKLKGCGFTIMSNNNIWKSSKTYYGGLIDVSTIRGAKLRLESRYDAGCDYTFVKSAPVEGATPSYAEGYTKVEGISASTIATIDIPSDASYLYVYMYSDSVCYIPMSIKMPYNGEDIFKEKKGASFEDSQLRNLGENNIIVGTWNIGHFSNGELRNSDITAANYESKLAAFRALIYGGKLSAVIGISEYSNIFGTSSAGKQGARNKLFMEYGNAIECEQRNYSCNAIFGNTICSNFVMHDFECLKDETISHISIIKAQDYYYADCDVYIKGQRVKFVQTHLAFDNNRVGVLQKKQLDELAEVYGNEERCIIVGDFNTTDNTLYSALVSAGFSLMNDGTYKTYPADSMALDNICVKGLVASGVYMPNAVGLSDHNPLFCKVSLESDIAERIEVPAPPSSGNYKLVARNGVTSWEAM